MRVRGKSFRNHKCDHKKSAKIMAKIWTIKFPHKQRLHKNSAETVAPNPAVKNFADEWSKSEPCIYGYEWLNLSHYFVNHLINH
jgi:hypothetical protein